MPHKEIGEVLKVFGIKSSGSHKERRQRLWLHLNYDSRRMTIENLAEMNRDDLHEMCKSLELELTGNRTVLMGRVAGVLTSQMRGGGESSAASRGMESQPRLRQLSKQRKRTLPRFQLRLLMRISGHSLTSTSRGFWRLTPNWYRQSVQPCPRGPSHYSRQSGGSRENGRDYSEEPRGLLGEAEKDLLLRLADRRGWPIDEQFVRHRVLMVATNIAEVKGASMASDENTIRAMEDAESTIERIRSKLSSLD